MYEAEKNDEMTAQMHYITEDTMRRTKQQVEHERWVDLILQKCVRTVALDRPSSSSLYVCPGIERLGADDR